MNRLLLTRALAPAVVAAVLSLPTTADACTVCMGDVNSKTAGAMNAAIFLMIGFVGTMLASLGAFALYLSRRASAPTPPHAEFDSAHGEPNPFS